MMLAFLAIAICFNPRTYIRYDIERTGSTFTVIRFQSTYLYKVRQFVIFVALLHYLFQSTYLYKVRQSQFFGGSCYYGFNPRTYIRYDKISFRIMLIAVKFQSTYLYKVRPYKGVCDARPGRFQSTYLYKVRPLAS